MGGVTGIEFGPDSCTMARVHVSAGTTHVSAVHGLDPDDGRPGDPDFADRLRQARRAGRFPRLARVVAWGIGEFASPNDPTVTLTLHALVRAGFVLDAVLSPPQALAVLARARPRSTGRTGEAWLALNHHGTAIAILHGGELVFARVLDWNRPPASTPREELLDRYLRVAHVAPELRHGFDVVGAQRGIGVDSIVTCGNLPDLRSFTMPLIEELDREVETLDSLAGLTLAPAVAARVGESGAGLRLACAAAVSAAAPTASRWRPLAAAAALVLVGAALWGAVQLGRSIRPENDDASRVPREVGPAARSPDSAGRPAGLATEGGDAPAGESQESGRSAAPPAEPPTGVAAPGTPEPTVGRRPPAVAENRDTDARRGVEPGFGRATRRQERPPAGGRRPEAAPPVAGAPGRRTQPQPSAPLQDPLPAVNSILVSPERRLAVLDGEIVREGDAVGPRVLVRIERDAVLLREPSGHEVRVPIRRRLKE